MSYPRVNLLNKSEQRYQGAVSKSFIFVIAVIAPVVIIAFLSSAKLVQYSSAKSDLDDKRHKWEELEPSLDFYKLENRGLSMNRKALDLYTGWEKSQASFSDILDEMQDVVPEQVQFTRLTIRGAATKETFKEAVDMQAKYDLIIEGKSHGTMAESHVIGLRKQLLARQQISNIFDSINLASLRQMQGANGQTLRDFRLEGSAAEVQP